MTAVHHVTVISGEAARLAVFFEDVLGLRSLTELRVPRSTVAALFGWPDGEGAIRSTLYGRGDRGLVEVVDWPDVPPEKETEPAGGQCRLVFVVADLARCVAAAADHGAVQVVGPVPVAAGPSVVSVVAFKLAGVRIQLVEGAG